ncbi:MAG: MBL fold metallo-hydrolase [Candidatus Lokiarchaeota archaeon]|nr:MBL fold metallo-hydrolase [Candidatus Lokiarchaeota archaeon]
MNIEIFGGIGEIGGNKIFINIGDKKFLFDFGLSFSDNQKYFSEFLNPRKFNGIIDYLYLGLIPPINKLYRNDLITPFSNVLNSDPYNIITTNENIVEAFFLTHAHLDHYKFIGFLKQNTPIYMNWVSNTILEHLTNTSKDTLLSEVLNFYESFKMVPKKRQSSNGEIEYKRATKPDHKPSDIKRPIRIMKEGKPSRFKSSQGEINITQFQTDHSIPGACSYIIENDGRSIIYTGDFRRHGFHSEWVDEFIKYAHNSNPVSIITEGTRVPTIEDFKKGSYRSEEQSESEVKKQSADVIKDHSGLILMRCPSRNLDRILLYYSLAKKFNRRFAITPKIFHLIDSFRTKFDEMDESRIKQYYHDYKLPDYSDKNFVVYLPRKGWGKFEAADYKEAYQNDIFKIDNYITYKDVQKEPDKYLLYLDFFMLSELIDLNQKPNSALFLNSTTDPFSEEMIIQEERLNAWLKRFNISKTKTIHSSGHCNVDKLIDFLQKIDADNIIPVHTEHPETFREFGLSGKVILPEKGKKYTI